MKRRFGVEAILFVASLVLCVVSALAYIKRDDGAFKDVKIELDSQGTKMLRLFSDNQMLEQRVISLEKNGKPQSMVLSMEKPIDVNVVYSPRTQEENKVPPIIINRKDGDTLNKKYGEKKSKSPLLDKAGITNVR